MENNNIKILQKLEEKRFLIFRASAKINMYTYIYIWTEKLTCVGSGDNSDFVNIIISKWMFF